MTTNTEQAFPHYPSAGYAPGMTLRDYFAAKAMQAITTSKAYQDGDWEHSNIAVSAYQIADAMLKARSA